MTTRQSRFFVILCIRFMRVMLLHSFGKVPQESLFGALLMDLRALEKELTDE